MPYTVDRKQIEELRTYYGVGLMEAHDALFIMRGDINKAKEYLRDPRYAHRVHLEITADAVARLEL